MAHRASLHPARNSCQVPCISALLETASHCPNHVDAVHHQLTPDNDYEAAHGKQSREEHQRTCPPFVLLVGILEPELQPPLQADEKRNQHRLDEESGQKPLQRHLVSMYIIAWCRRRFTPFPRRRFS